MKKLGNLRVVSADTNINGLRKLFDEIESIVISLESLVVMQTAMEFYLCQL